MNTLEVKRLDSPLARGDRRPSRAVADRSPKAAEPHAVARATPQQAASPEASRLTSIPEPTRPPTPSDDSLVALPQPPALGEPLELISSRLPMSLRRSLSELTVALRVRGGGRVSQKQLPEQELLAVLVWLAGSADDPRAVERLGASLDAFRARRFAAAAEALSSR